MAAEVAVEEGAASRPSRSPAMARTTSVGDSPLGRSSGGLPEIRPGFLPGMKPSEMRKSRAKGFFAPEKPKKQWPTIDEDGGEGGELVLQNQRDYVELGDSLDVKWNALLHEFSEEFYRGFRVHMYEELQKLYRMRKLAQAQEAKMERDEQIEFLEARLLWFMTESLRLDQQCNELRNDVEVWRMKKHMLSADVKIQDDKAKSSHRQNQVIWASSQRAHLAQQSAINMGSQTRSRPSNALVALADGPKGLNRSSSSSSSLAAFPSASTDSPVQGRMASTLRPSASLGALVPVASAGTSRVSRLVPPDSQISRQYEADLQGPTLGNSKEKLYADTIRDLQEQLAKAKRDTHLLRAARGNGLGGKSELEGFFLQCVDDARKELARKWRLPRTKDITQQERVYERLLSSEDIMCFLYEKLFPHRKDTMRNFMERDLRMGMLPAAPSVPPSVSMKMIAGEPKCAGRLYTALQM